MAPAFAFVDELEQMRPLVTGTGNTARFDYWLNTFKYHRSLARVRCSLGAFHKTMKTVEAETSPQARAKQAETLALPAYRKVLKEFKESHRLLLSTVDTPGGLATVCEFHKTDRFWGEVVANPAARLAKALGHPLPADAMPGMRYEGRPRLIVPTVRSQVEAGEALSFDVIVLDNAPPASATLFWRPLGQGRFKSLPLRHIARATYRASLPPSRGESIECYIQATASDGTRIVWPPTAPHLNHTVVVMGEAD